jgi:HK97 family phage prohead protease
MKNKLFSAAFCKNIINEKEQIVHVIASTGVVDRHGESVNPNGWLLENYLKNPVVLIAHDYRSLPIGKVTKVWVENEELHAYIQIADTEAGQEVFYLISKGFLNTVSVGFIPTKYGVAGQDKYTIMEQELLEISFVAVPANPEALIDNNVQQRFAYLQKSLDESQFKTVVPFESYDIDENSAWDGEKARDQIAKWASKDGSGEKDKIDWVKYSKGFTWYDGEKKEDLNSYKLPHHYVKDDKLITVWSGVKAAMGALLGSRGGVDIPQDEKKGVYNHLAKHYKEFNKEAPELKDYSINELLDLEEKGLVLLNQEIVINKNELKELKNKALLGEDIKKAMREVLAEVKVVEEKIVEKVIKVNEKELSPEAVNLLMKIRAEMRKSDRFSGISLKLLNSLLKVKNSANERG